MNKMIKFNGKLNIVGPKIRKYRESQNLSLSQLSNQLQLMGIDIPKSSLYNIEIGKRVIKEFEFAALCKFFKIPMEEMLKEFLQELE